MACIRWCDCFVVFYIIASSGDVKRQGCSNSGGGFLAEVIFRMFVVLSGLCAYYKSGCGNMCVQNLK